MGCRLFSGAETLGEDVRVAGPEKPEMSLQLRGTLKMPKHAKGKRAQPRSSRKGGMGSCAMAFRVVYYTTANTGANWTTDNFPLHPAFLGDVQAAIRQNYELFRVTSLKVVTRSPVGGYYYAPGTPFSQMVACGYSQEYDESTPPGGFGSMSQGSYFDMENGFSRGASIQVPRGGLLKEPLKWWKCNTSTSSPTNDQIYQGRVQIGLWVDSTSVSTACRYWTVASGTIEYSNPVDSAVEVKHKSQPDRAMPLEAPDADLLILPSEAAPEAPQASSPAVSVPLRQRLAPTLFGLLDIPRSRL